MSAVSVAFASQAIFGEASNSPADRDDLDLTIACYRKCRSLRTVVQITHGGGLSLTKQEE